MTEKIFNKQDMQYKLWCMFRDDVFAARSPQALHYVFCLWEREKGRRNWIMIFDWSVDSSDYSDVSELLKYLSKEEILEVAEAEHDKFKPTNILKV